MRRILDIDKLQENRGGRGKGVSRTTLPTTRSGGRRKRLGHHHLHLSLLRESIISQIIDLMCRVDWQDYELRIVWTILQY